MSVLAMNATEELHEIRKSLVAVEFFNSQRSVGFYLHTNDKMYKLYLTPKVYVDVPDNMPKGSAWLPQFFSTLYYVHNINEGRFTTFAINNFSPSDHNLAICIIEDLTGKTIQELTFDTVDRW